LPGDKRTAHNLPLAIPNLQFAICALSLLAVGGYLVEAALHGTLGFPLDDAWIHQTYARNLVRYGEWAYVPGQPSAGSTAPLWTLLIALGYWLGVDYRWWTYGLGLLSLWLTAWAAYRLARRLFPDRPAVAWGGALFCALEWHLVWAACSGMETVLFTALALLVMERGVTSYELGARGCKASVRGGVVGILTGLLVLTRPEGLLLGGLLLLYCLGRGISKSANQQIANQQIANQQIANRQIGKSQPSNLPTFQLSNFFPCLSLLATCLLLLLPWLFLNWRLSGHPFPNTFYAKQQEYRALLGLPLWTRVGRVVLPTLVGAQVLLLPGFMAEIASIIRNRLSAIRNPQSLPLLWWSATIAIYTLRLPVNYQHGRYLMPVIPVFVLYGLAGTVRWLRPAASEAMVRVLSQAFLAALAVLLLAFLVLGGQAYRDDMGFVEGEMVATAHWLNENTPPEALIAVHDIGAVGYFLQRPLLDLAGLVTPQVIPFIADETRLLEFMEQKGADYLVCFPDFSPAYARLVRDPRLREVYRTGYPWTLEQGHANMTVYQLKSH